MCTNLEEPLGVLSVQLEELSSGTSDLGEGKLNSPDLPLVPESVLSGELFVPPHQHRQRDEEKSKESGSELVWSR